MPQQDHQWMYHDSEKHAHAWPLLQMAANFRLGYGTAQRRKRHNGETIHSSTLDRPGPVGFGLTCI
jgi:hypothetical protein